MIAHLEFLSTGEFITVESEEKLDGKRGSNSLRSARFV